MDKNKEQIIKPGLYLISTPIGNMQDITFRAINILKKSDIILCEDTRRSFNLLSYYNIKKKLFSYHKFNEKKNSEKIINLIKENKVVSLISDAGTPTISDPGLVLVKKCIQQDLNVHPIPGSSAVIAAMSVSGFEDKFLFYGFLNKKENELNKVLKSIANLDYSLIFFIPANKINFYLNLFKKYFNNREILIAKEITKIHEEFIRGKIDSIKPFPQEAKGELTVIISKQVIKNNSKNVINESVKLEIKKMLKKYSHKDVVEYIVKKENLPKKLIYDYCLKIKWKKKLLIIFTLFLLTSCVGSSTSGVFGSGVSIALDPRTLGTQIDDSIMQKNLQARLALTEKKYLIKLSVKVLDGRIFLSGKVDEAEEKLKVTKMAWETKGARSVKNNIVVKQKFSFKNAAVDVLITSQLRTALILNKKVKAANFNIDTVNQKTYVFGIAHSNEEKKEIIQEAKQIVDLKELITSILLVSDLSRKKE